MLDIMNSEAWSIATIITAKIREATKTTIAEFKSWLLVGQDTLCTSSL